MTVTPIDSATDPTASPAAPVRVQDDLFRHVNGEWLATAVIPDDRSMDGAFYHLRDGAEADSRAIVEEAAAQAAAGAEPGSPAQLIGDLFRSFMDTDTVESLGLGPVTEQLAQIDDVTDVEEPAAGHRAGPPGRGRRTVPDRRRQRSGRARPLRPEPLPVRHRPAGRVVLHAPSSTARFGRHTRTSCPRCWRWPGCRTPTSRPAASTSWRPSWPPDIGTGCDRGTARRPSTRWTGPDSTRCCRPRSGTPGSAECRPHQHFSSRLWCGSRTSSSPWPAC